MKYKTQYYDDPSKQHFMWGNSSELKLENRKVPVSGGIQVTNKLTLNYEFFFVIEEAYVDTVYVV